MSYYGKLMRQHEAREGYRSYDWGIPQAVGWKKLFLSPFTIPILVVYALVTTFWVPGGWLRALSGIGIVLALLTGFLQFYPVLKAWLVNRDARRFLKTKHIAVNVKGNPFALAEFLFRWQDWEEDENRYPISYTTKDGIEHNEQMLFFVAGKGAWCRLIIPVPEFLKKEGDGDES